MRCQQRQRRKLRAEYVLVAATARSSPASIATTESAASASGEPGSLVIAIVGAPERRARSTYSTTSGVRPDCDSAITQESPASSSVP